MIAALHYSAETWVALCTGLLAGATFLLALLTGVMARATRAEIAVTVRPLVVDAPLGVFMQERAVPGSSVPIGQAFPRNIVDRAWSSATADSGVVEVAFTIRNAGSGPALVRSFRIETPDGTRPGLELSHTVIPLGEPAVVTARWTLADTSRLTGDEWRAREAKTDEFLRTLSRFKVTIAYSDMTGRQRLVSVLQVAGEFDEQYGSQWGVERVDLFRESRLFRRNPKPFARLGDAALVLPEPDDGA